MPGDIGLGQAPGGGWCWAGFGGYGHVLITRHFILADIVARRCSGIGTAKWPCDEALAEKFAVIGFSIRLAEHGRAVSEKPLAQRCWHWAKHHGATAGHGQDQIICKRFRIPEFRCPSFLRVYRWREHDHGSKKQLTHREAPPQVQSGRRDIRQKPRILPRPKGSPKMPATDAALQ